MFEVDDIELAMDELKSKNAKIIGNIRGEPYGKLLTFEDPDGHWLKYRIRMNNRVYWSSDIRI